MKHILSVIISILFLCLSLYSVNASTLETVKTNDNVRCGVSLGIAGFSQKNSSDEWKGFDIDLCRAIAAAVLGDANKIVIIPLSKSESFTLLKEGKVDVLTRKMSWSLTNEAQKDVLFTGISFFDRQSFMVRDNLGISSALELSSASICVEKNTSNEMNVTDFFISNNMEYEVVSFENALEVVAAYDLGRCTALSADASALYAYKNILTNPDEHIIFADIIAKQPLGPIVNRGDDQWFNIVKWSLFALINAEELGITSKNIEDMKSSKVPAIQRLLGVNDQFDITISGLDKNWAANIIAQVGNYGEIFETNFGALSEIKLERGMNALWNKGGLLYAPPIR